MGSFTGSLIGWNTAFRFFFVVFTCILLVKKKKKSDNFLKVIEQCSQESLGKLFYEALQICLEDIQ